MANSRPSRGKLCVRVVIDIVCIALVAIPIGLFTLIGVPYHRGFFCNDESLKHPFLGNTIPTWLLGVVGLGLPILCILVIEALHEKKTSCFGIVSTDPNEHTKSYFEKCYKIIIVFIFGSAVTQLLTEIGKFSIGRLRPHFFAVCNPDMANIDCNSGYIMDFTCKGTNSYRLRDMRLSFPSGHASIAVYCMIFLMAYLQARLTTARTNLIRPVMQLVAFGLAFFTCLSRISDYKHHWSDVLAGAILGTLISCLVITFLSSFRLERRSVMRFYRSRHEKFPLYHQNGRQETSSSGPSDDTAEMNEELTHVISHVSRGK
ncbi:phospholipid phosphatase 1-like [Haliotis cracherodii]|uniref:phospholipid phosphatase 1-like n=1 Tax=Haliotis cracherodii TaxID=6455 RepID=UPI0039E991A6